jgi:hypothetical protein
MQRRAPGEREARIYGNTGTQRGTKALVRTYPKIAQLVDEPAPTSLMWPNVFGG